MKITPPLLPSSRGRDTGRGELFILSTHFYKSGKDDGGKRRSEGKAEDQDGRKDEGDHDGLLYRCENRRADGEEGRLDHERRSGGAADRDGRDPGLSGEPRCDGRGEQDGGGPLREGGGDGLFERPLFLCPRRHRLRPDQRRADRRPPAARHAGLLQQHLRDRPEMVRGAGPVFQGSALHPRHPRLPYGFFRGGETLRQGADRRVHCLPGEGLREEVRL